MLTFPSIDVLRLALTSGVIPPGVADKPVTAVFEADGAIRVEPAGALARTVRAELRRLGVQEEKVKGPKGEPFACWPQVLPLRREPTCEVTGPTTPVVFELAAREVPELVGEILRLGNDRQGI